MATRSDTAQRYYANSYGRFNTPDPLARSARPRVPASWNRYSYTMGDPVNRRDPRGLDCVEDEEGDCARDERSQSGYEPPEDVCGDWGLPEGCSFGPTDPITVTQEGGGGGGQSGAAVASQALIDFQSMDFSPHCHDFIDKTYGMGTLDMLQLKAQSVFVVDAATVGAAAGVSLFPNDPENAASQQASADALTGIRGSALYQMFAAAPTIKAAAQWGGNQIFFSETGFGACGSGYAMYTIFHEMLHSAALGGDTQIKAAFGITDAVWASQGTQAITNKLIEECN